MTKLKPPAPYDGFFINWPVFSSRVADFFCVMIATMLVIAFFALVVALGMNMFRSVFALFSGGCHP
jgi:cytochrome bd-type quinol oxidase subunit 1